MVQVKYRSRLPAPQPTVVHVRRSYAESRYGQIHLSTAYPSGGGFDEHTPVICLHHSGGSGQLFTPMLRELGRDRSVYAPDLPGHGMSDPTSRASVVDLAGAVGDFMDSLRLRAVDIFGYQLGALIATELAVLRTQQVRRLILWGIAGYSSQERATLLAQTRAAGWRDDGSDVAEEWRQLLARRGPGEPMAALLDDFSARLGSAGGGARAFAAAVEYPAGERLPLVKQQTLVLRLKDEFYDHAARMRSMLPTGGLLDVPDFGHGFISAAPQRFAAIAREFLDR